MLFILKNSYKTEIYLLLLFSLISFIFAWPVFYNFDNWGILDWDQHLFYHAVPRLTILEYGQIPLWNPYYCGGSVLLANPQSRFLSPSFLLILLFGEVRGLKLEIWLHLVIGLLGSYNLARYYTLSKLAAILTSLIFMLNSMYTLALSVGMTWFLSVAYLPWIFLFYLKAFRQWQYVLASSFSLVLMFFSGGAYPLSITILFLGFYSLLLVSFKAHPFFKVVKLLGLSLIFMLCLGAIKFFPTMAFLQEHPRPIYDYSGFSLNSLQHSLLNRNQTLDSATGIPQDEPGFINGISYRMDENGMYIGLIPFLLFFIGLGFHDKLRMYLFLSLMIFLWISFGNRPHLELWSYLHLLPVYDSMRVAQRFRIIVVLCLAIFVGFGFQTMKQYILELSRSSRLVEFFALMILIVIFIDLTLANAPIFAQAFSIPPLKMSKTDRFYQVWDIPAYDQHGWKNSYYGSSLYPAFLSNIGIIDCYETANVPRKAIPISDKSYQGEVYLSETAGFVEISEWTPNSLVITVDALNDGVVILNQNYYSGWSTTAGHTIGEHNGLLTIEVSAGYQRIVLTYWPTSFVIGSIVTITTLCLTFLFGLMYSIKVGN